MTFEQILKELKAKNYQPIYFLQGKEPYFIDTIASYIEKNVLNEGEKSFNQTILYGKDTDYKTVRDIAMRFPMMAEKQVVILKEAQDMRTLGDLAAYIEKPVPTTILVICYKHKKFDGRTKFGKLVKKNTVFFESKPLYDNQIPGWISSYLKQRKLDISPNAAQLVTEYLGTSLSNVANELDKLVLNVPEGTKLNIQHIQDNIGISKAYNVFELQKALGTRDVLKANRIINYFEANPKQNPMVMVVSSLYNYFSKIYLLHYLKNASDQDVLKALSIGSSYFLKEYKAAARQYNLPKTKQIIGLLSTYDLRSKGVENGSAEHGALMKELVYKIMH